MEQTLTFPCPHCGALQRKDFRDILSATMGCPVCQMAFDLDQIRSALDRDQWGDLYQTLEAKKQQQYGPFLNITEAALRRNARWILDHLEGSPQGLLIEALQHRVPYPAQCRDTLNLLVQMDLITWHGTPGNEYVKRIQDEE